VVSKSGSDLRFISKESKDGLQALSLHVWQPNIALYLSSELLSKNTRSAENVGHALKNFFKTLSKSDGLNTNRLTTENT